MPRRLLLACVIHGMRVVPLSVARRSGAFLRLVLRDSAGRYVPDRQEGKAGRPSIALMNHAGLFGRMIALAGWQRVPFISLPQKLIDRSDRSFHQKQFWVSLPCKTTAPF